jgi:hypothetical protein
MLVTGWMLGLGDWSLGESLDFIDFVFEFLRGRFCPKRDLLWRNPKSEL